LKNGRSRADNGQGNYLWQNGILYHKDKVLNQEVMQSFSVGEKVIVLESDSIQTSYLVYGKLVPLILEFLIIVIVLKCPMAVLWKDMQIFSVRLLLVLVL
jgi:hypothetical protein